MKKIMKFQILTIICLVMLYVLPSCTKSMLEEEVYSQPSESNVSGPAGAALLTNGIYGFLQFYSYSSGNQFLLTEAGTDEFLLKWGSGFSSNQTWGGTQNFLNMSSAHDQVQLQWDRLYKIIAQCNVVINQYSSATDAATIQNVAQAKFWRAYTYYKLNNVYGPVPLIKGGEDQSNGIARASANEMDAFIEPELKSVVSVLPTSYSTSDYGRPTSWAAKAFLARYYLDKHRWKEASDLAKDVINNGGFSLMTNYQDIFGQNGNSEVILAIVEIAQSNRGNKYVALSLDQNVRIALGIKGVSASNGYGMSTPFYNSFAANDKRIAPYDRNTGKGIAIAGIILDSDGKPAYTDSNKNPMTIQDALYRVLTCKWPVIQNIPRGEDAPLNMPLLRLGETMLTYAEAQNELGNVPEAATYLNKIRERVGLANTTANDQVSMRKAILDERGWELYHEGYRREDLMRAGAAEYLARMNNKSQYYLGKSIFSASDAYKILEPIPISAMRLNPLLKQNTGLN